MVENKTVDTTVAQLSVIVQQHDRRISNVEDSMKALNNHLSSLDVKLSALTERVNGLEDKIKSSNARLVWTVGTILTVVNIVISLAIRMIH